MNKIISSLTEKQRKFYEVLKSYADRHGEAPTIQEMARSLKLSSPRSISQYLMVLEKKGLIQRSRYERRGIRVLELENEKSKEEVEVPVIASAGCDNVNVFAQSSFDEFLCVASDLLQGRKKESVVGIRAVGDSMKDAGINENDYVLVEITQAIYEEDLVVAIIDGFAVIKKIQFANNAIILHPVSSDPQYKPIIVNRNFQIFGKVIDIVRAPQKGDLEVVPLYSTN
ncbi:MAG: transcriptional repressor LexA [Candidatus Liptonbacteria bacterium]